VASEGRLDDDMKKQELHGHGKVEIKQRFPLSHGRGYGCWQSILKTRPDKTETAFG
jgi:hypothetical protein